MPELRSLHFLFLEFAQASLAHPQIKNAPVGGMGLGCGERGIRTPGPVTVNGFQDRRNRPLCHLSAAKVVKIDLGWLPKIDSIQSYF